MSGEDNKAIMRSFVNEVLNNQAKVLSHAWKRIATESHTVFSKKEPSAMQALKQMKVLHAAILVNDFTCQVQFQSFYLAI